MCKTDAGEPCKFPFEYKGVSYEKCTTKDQEVHWCYTNQWDIAYGYTYSGNCDSNCPSEYPFGTCGGTENIKGILIR